MKTNGQAGKPHEGPTLEVVPHGNGGFFVMVSDEVGAWPFQSEAFNTREEAEEKLSGLNAPLAYEALCSECKAGFTEQEFLKADIVSGLWACPCSENSLLFPRTRTVEESVRRIQEFMTQRGG